MEWNDSRRHLWFICWIRYQRAIKLAWWAYCGSPFSLDLSLKWSSRTTSTISKVLHRQFRFHSLFVSNSMTGSSSCTEVSTVCIHYSSPSQHGSFFVNIPWLRSQSDPPSLVQMKPDLGPTSTIIHQMQPITQVAANINSNIPPTTR